MISAAFCGLAAVHAFGHLGAEVEHLAHMKSTIDKLFGGWTKAQATHFADGGIFDQIYQPGK